MSFWDVVLLMVMSVAFLALVAHQATRGNGLAEVRPADRRPAERRPAGRDRIGSVRR